MQFAAGKNASALGIEGTETFKTIGLSDDIKPGQRIVVQAVRNDGTSFDFDEIVRLDCVVDIEYYRNGGIMKTVVRNMINK